MSETLHLLATIAGQRVALDAGAVDSVVAAEAVTPVPRAPAHVAGLSALRSRALTIIDCVAALGLAAPEANGGSGSELIVVTVDGHLYGLRVDRIDDAVPLATLPLAVGPVLAPGWARATCGFVEHDGGLLLLIDPAVLVAGPAVRAA